MFALLKELIRFARVYRKYWIVPVVLLMLMVGGLVVVAQSSALGPFLYALF
jgi:hypothetical protein